MYTSIGIYMGRKYLHLNSSHLGRNDFQLFFKQTIGCILLIQIISSITIKGMIVKDKKELVLKFIRRV